MLRLSILHLRRLLIICNVYHSQRLHHTQLSIRRYAQDTHSNCTQLSRTVHVSNVKSHTNATFSAFCSLHANFKALREQKRPKHIHTHTRGGSPRPPTYHAAAHLQVCNMRILCLINILHVHLFHYRLLTFAKVLAICLLNLINIFHDISSNSVLCTAKSTSPYVQHIC